MTVRPFVLTPLRIEAAAVRRGAPGVEVVTTGMGPARSRRATTDLAARCAEAPAVVIAGFCGALDDTLQPGDVVVASEVRGPDGPDGTDGPGGHVGPDGRSAQDAPGGLDASSRSLGSVSLPGAEVLAAEMRRAGLRATVGAIQSVERAARGEHRAELGATGAVAADMESWWLLASVPNCPRMVVRVVVDTPAHELPSVWTLRDGVRAGRALRRAAAIVESWGLAVAERDVLLAAPRSFCAGVDRAIDIVERGLDRFGAPLYVRRQIVHNRHVVDQLTERGAVFVEELDEVPDGATVVFSAHGVPPGVRAEADARGLHVIDATCPLVAKVHSEIRRFSRQGYGLVLIGHDGHDETEGTLGEADGIRLVTTVEDADRVEVDDPRRVAYVTQTTLAVDEVRGIVERLEQRFPDLVGPAADDICYATQNRQDAVRSIAADCDLLLVVGSTNSSNSNRLVEVARREGCAAELIDDETEIRVGWLTGARTIGVTAGASAPESVVQKVVDALAALGPVTVAERSVVVESTQFALPSEVR